MMFVVDARNSQPRPEAAVGERFESPRSAWLTTLESLLARRVGRSARAVVTVAGFVVALALAVLD